MPLKVVSVICATLTKPNVVYNSPKVCSPGNTYSVQGLSFLALILLSGRLYEASKEISFLRVVLAAWMPSEADLLGDDHKATSVVLDRSRQTLTNLKGDLESFLCKMITG